jgi:hypothetical protein
MMGRIQRHPAQVQVDFLRLCCQYWKNEGNYSIEDAKLDAAESYDVLVKYKIIKEKLSHIEIDFLDEQLDCIEDRRRQASEAGKKSAAAKKRRAKLNESSTTVEEPLNDSSTESNRVEESREEKSREREDKALPPPPDHSLITWIKKNTPRVHKMKKPLTNEEAERLIADLDIGKNERGEMLRGILMSMENYVPLLNKSVSANLTIRKWWKMEEERKASGKPKQAEETFVPRTEIYYK